MAKEDHLQCRRWSGRTKYSAMSSQGGLFLLLLIFFFLGGGGADRLWMAKVPTLCTCTLLGRP